MKKFVELPKLKYGDRVAIVSPAGDAAGRFPWVYELGLQRLEKEFGLKPKEYPTTQKIGASHEEKAKDLMEAFSETDNKAIFATIGGFDQIQMLKLLSPDVFIKNPKPFFGSSDNTQFVNFLWNHNIPSYYCGSIMPQLAFPATMPELSVEYLKHAMFDRGEYEIKTSTEFNEETNDWADEKKWPQTRKMEPNRGWLWEGAKTLKGSCGADVWNQWLLFFQAG